VGVEAERNYALACVMAIKIVRGFAPLLLQNYT